ncbi:unnamed protein product, partial [Brassica oleracea]
HSTLCANFRSKSLFVSSTFTKKNYFKMSMSSEEENHRKNVEDKAEMGRKKRAIWERKWRRLDIVKAFASFFVHFLCLLAPFNFTWPALRVALVVYTVGGLGITVSYHRNLAHRSFKVPKWLEYLFAYCGLLAIQGDPIDWVSTHRYHHQFTDSDRDPHSPKEGFWFSHLLWLFDTGYLVEKGHPIDWVSTHRFHHQFTDSDRDPHSPIEGFWFSHVFWVFDSSYIREKVTKLWIGGRDNVMDLKQQWFYRFLRNTIGLHIMTFWTLVYLWGGLPYLTCGVGVGGTITYHGTGIVNSACHIWGSRAWNTKDTSRNIWWLGPFTMGESWHNNHHAFETSARYGLEWYQVDLTWYLISFFQALGLATDVKLPSEAQKRKLAFAR